MIGFIAAFFSAWLPDLWKVSVVAFVGLAVTISCFTAVISDPDTGDKVMAGFVGLVLGIAPTAVAGYAIAQWRRYKKEMKQDENLSS